MMATDIIVVVIAGWAGWIAWKGWKKEMRGQTEYKLALGLLVELHKYHNVVRKALSYFDPLRATTKSRPPPREPPVDIQDHADSQFLDMYEQFLTDIATQQEVLYEHLLSAEIIWPERLPDLFKQLLNAVSRLESPIIERILDHDPLSLNRIILNSPYTSEEDANGITYDHTYDQKKLSNEIQKYVKEIEDIVKPELKPRGWKIMKIFR